MESDTTEASVPNIIIVTKKYRVKLFFKLYWRVLIIVITPIIFTPLFLIKNKTTEYATFYVFLVMAVYWISDALHPAVTALIPAALSPMIQMDHADVIHEMSWNGLVDTLSMRMMIIAIEYSELHRRIAVKILLVFGCSHYRLSFILFTFCMFMSMWVASIAACSLMMPIVKAILDELDKMGIIDTFATEQKTVKKSSRHELNDIEATDFTTFYYLGIAYSSIIGSMASINANPTNWILKEVFDTSFPFSRKMQYPHFMLLNLPGVLVMEIALYMWMNFYVLGSFRVQNEISPDVGLTEEESMYVQTLLSTKYTLMGRMTFHEIMVLVMISLAIILQLVIGVTYSSLSISLNTLMCVIILFCVPTEPDFIKFCRKRTSIESGSSLPSAKSKACLNWRLVRENVNWSVFFIIVGSSAIMTGLKSSGMGAEFELFLLNFRSWPPPAMAGVVIIFAKLLSEFAPPPCVDAMLLPSVAKLSIVCKINPLYLMISAYLGSALPFHLVTASPVYAAVVAYVPVPPKKIMHAGIGPSAIGIIIAWLTVTLWARTIWTDISDFPGWAQRSTLIADV